MKYNGAIIWNSITDLIDHSIAGIINMQPTNDISLRIMTSRDITVVKSLENLSMVVLNKLRVKNIECDKYKFIFKLKYLVCMSCRV